MQGFGYQANQVGNRPRSRRRYATISSSINREILVVIHTENDDDVLRIISARPATPKERRNYEKS